MKPTKLYGLHSVQAALDYSPKSINKAWIDAQRQDKRLTQAIEALLDLGNEPEKVDRKKLDRFAEGNHHQGIVIEVDMPGELSENELKTAVENLTTSALFLVLDNVQDPHNLGACLRTAASRSISSRYGVGGAECGEHLHTVVGCKGDELLLRLPVIIQTAVVGGQRHRIAEAECGGGGDGK